MKMRHKLSKEKKSKKKEEEKYQVPKKEKEKNMIQRVLNEFEVAKNKKEYHIKKCKIFNEYYHNQHYSADVLAAFEEKYGVDFVPPVLPEPFVQVESQVDTILPAFQFRGRDEQLDPEKAKQRENIVKYVLQANKMDEQLLNNERELNKYGDAFWNVTWDNMIKRGPLKGDISIGISTIGQIFPDPSANSLESAEHIFKVYRMHMNAGRRRFGPKFNEVVADGEHQVTEIFNNLRTTLGNQSFMSSQNVLDDNTVQIIEYYYRDDEGDIALMIIANEVLLKHIKKFWEKTRHSGNQMFPIVQWSKTPVLESFWNIGEIEMILDLVDAADRELATALLNDAFMANDIVIAPENAKPDGVEWDNAPGSLWLTAQGASSLVQRLGGISNNNGLMNMMEMLTEKIQQANGNSDSAMGIEPNRVTTASGIAQLNERADKRKGKKMAGRLVGLKNLIQLVDWFALEFYDEDRMVIIEGKDENDVTYGTFNSQDHLKQKEAKGERFPDLRKDELIENKVEEKATEFYFPQVDCIVDVGQGFQHSPAFTFQATSELMQYPITPFNVEVAKALVDILDLKGKREIKDSFDKNAEFQMMQMQAEMQASQAQTQAATAQAQFAQQGAVDNAQELSGTQEAAGITEDEAIEFIASLPEDFQKIIMDLPEDMILEAVEDMSQLNPEEVADYLIELI